MWGPFLFLPLFGWDGMGWDDFQALSSAASKWDKVKAEQLQRARKTLGINHDVAMEMHKGVYRFGCIEAVKKAGRGVAVGERMHHPRGWKFRLPSHFCCHIVLFSHLLTDREGKLLVVTTQLIREIEKNPFSLLSS